MKMVSVVDANWHKGNHFSIPWGIQNQKVDAAEAANTALQRSLIGLQSKCSFARSIVDRNVDRRLVANIPPLDAKSSDH